MVADFATQQEINGLRERCARLEGELIDIARAVAMGTAGGIYAIKAYRAATGSTLQAAKEWHDKLSPRLRPSWDDNKLNALEDRVAQLERMERARHISGCPNPPAFADIEEHLRKRV